MTINGNIQGCKIDTVTGARNIYNSFDSYSEAINQFKKITNRTDLSPFPVSRTVTEDTNAKKIDFNFVYNDDLRPKINILYNISFNYEYENDNISATIEATITNRAAYSDTLWSQIVSIADNIDLYSILVPSYNVFVTEVNPAIAIYPLNPIPLSTSRQENRYKLEITLSDTFDSRPINPVGLKTYDYTLNFDPAIHKYSAQPILDGVGAYYVFDLGFSTRNKLTINVNGIGDDNTSLSQVKTILRDKIQSYMAQYLKGGVKLLEGQTFTQGNESFNKKYQINAVYSAEDSAFSIP